MYWRHINQDIKINCNWLKKDLSKFVFAFSWDIFINQYMQNNITIQSTEADKNIKKYN